MSEYPKIESPEFIDVQKTRVRFLLVAENGIKTVAELKVPDNRELGVNDHWDKIVANFDVEQMAARRNNIERKKMIEQSVLDKKRKAAIENLTLQTLFDKKLQFFNLHFINDLTYEEKSAVRRAPNETFLNIAILIAIQNYTQRTGKPLLELFDEIEDEQYKQTTSIDSQATEVTEQIDEFKNEADQLTKDENSDTIEPVTESSDLTNDVANIKTESNDQPTTTIVSDSTEPPSEQST